MVESWMSRSTSRRACSRLTSRLARVMSRSANGRSSFALGRVVRIRSRSNSAVARLRRSAVRWGVMRPSFRWATRCLILYPCRSRRNERARAAAGLLLAVSLRRRPGVELHAEGGAHPAQDLLDLVQRLAAEVLGLEHLGLGLLHELPDGPDVGVLEAVVGADGKLHLVHALAELLRPGLAVLLGDLRHRTLRLVLILLEVDEDREVVLHELGRQAHRVAGGHRPVGPHLEGELLVVGGLADPGRLHEVVDLLDGG